MFSWHLKSLNHTWSLGFTLGSKDQEKKVQRNLQQSKLNNQMARFWWQNDQPPPLSTDHFCTRQRREPFSLQMEARGHLWRRKSRNWGFEMLPRLKDHLALPSCDHEAWRVKIRVKYLLLPKKRKNPSSCFLTSTVDWLALTVNRFAYESVTLFSRDQLVE